ncbi:hypothetical protein B566_EDAN015233 [Ephemera danica]|nr:hypothetical protein B566_EDAN015233 [Ephemera danica]
MSSPNHRGPDPYTNEYFTEREYGDFTPFYVTIIICGVIALAIILLNIIFCCSSQYKDYWLNSNTGNRYLIPIWSRTPHNQPPLDYSELEGKAPPQPEFQYPPDFVEVPDYSHSSASTAAYSESRHYYVHHSKRESDI